jgi:RNA polymerase sigma-70 factor, ECF subfamily
MQAERYPTESALLTGAAGGDPDAVRALIDSIGPVVYGFVFARVGGNEPAAQDLLQETLIEALRSAPTFRGDASLRTWVCAIARRRLARHYEAERRQAVAESGLTLLGAVPWAGTEDERERRDEIVRALGRLPVLHRQVLVRKYLDDWPVADIAAELGRSPVQIQSLLQRARDGLRRELEEGGDA